MFPSEQASRACSRRAGGSAPHSNQHLCRKDHTVKSLNEQHREALKAEDPDLFSGEGEHPQRLVIDVFRSRARWLAIVAVIYSLVFVALAIFSAVRFFRVDSAHESVLWAAIFLLSMQIIGLGKIFFWMQMNRVSIMREMKRMELQFARLSAQIEKR